MSTATKERPVKKVPQPVASAAKALKAPVNRRKIEHPNRRVDHPGAIEQIDLSTQGGRITWARMRRSMTQKDLANAIDKSRVSVVQYEQNNIEPPISVMSLIADKLDVSASFLAFGEHGVVGVKNAEEELLSIGEVTYGRDGKYTSATMALPKSLLGDMVDEQARVSAFVLPFDAPAFDLQAGERVFADQTITSLVAEHDTYLIKVDNSFDIIRVEASLSSGGKRAITNRKGQKINVAAKDLEIIAAVVGSIRRH